MESGVESEVESRVEVSEMDDGTGQSKTARISKARQEIT